MPAPDDLERGSMLAALQGDDLSRRQFYAQSAQPAAQMTYVNGVRQLRLVGLEWQGDAQWQDHPGSGTALGSGGHHG
ncbi:MAG TPA: hypothetical protein VI386_03635 [Candidatus Sulfotelmatobacter sp.]